MARTQTSASGPGAQFRCVFGTERLARAALDTDPEEVETEAALPFPSPSSQPQVSPPLLLRGLGGVGAFGP